MTNVKTDLIKHLKHIQRVQPKFTDTGLSSYFKLKIACVGKSINRHHIAKALAEARRIDKQMVRDLPLVKMNESVQIGQFALKQLAK